MKPTTREEKIIQHLYEVDGFSLKEISRWFIENELPIMESEVNTFVKHAKLVRAKKNQAIATVETVHAMAHRLLDAIAGRAGHV